MCFQNFLLLVRIIDVQTVVIEALLCNTIIANNKDWLSDFGLDTDVSLNQLFNANYNLVVSEIIRVNAEVV